MHLAHLLGVKGLVKNDVRDAGDPADLLRMGRLPEAWIAPLAVRELRELVRTFVPSPSWIATQNWARSPASLHPRGSRSPATLTPDDLS